VFPKGPLPPPPGHFPSATVEVPTPSTGNLALHLELEWVKNYLTRAQNERDDHVHSGGYVSLAPPLGS